MVKARFVVPPDVSAVTDYELKYLLILRLALETPDITYLGAPESLELPAPRRPARARTAALLTESLATGRFDARATTLPAIDARRRRRAHHRAAGARRGARPPAPR